MSVSNFLRYSGEIRSLTRGVSVGYVRYSSSNPAKINRKMLNRTTLLASFEYQNEKLHDLKIWSTIIRSFRVWQVAQSC